MSIKRLTFKTAFLVRCREVKPCFAVKTTISEEFYTDSEGYLVFMDGSCQLIRDYKDEVFFSENDALREVERQREKHLKFCKEQIERYQEQLQEASK